MELGLGDDALDLDEVVLVLLAILRLREHKVCPLDNPRITACGYENNASVKGEKAKARKVKKGRTDVKLVPEELVPINHVLVHQDETPVVGELVLADADLDLLTVQNVAEYTLRSGGAILGGLSVELVRLLDLVLGGVDQVRELLTSLGHIGGLALHRLSKPLALASPNPRQTRPGRR